MKLWFIKTEEFLSIDQLYNTKDLGTIVDFSLEEINKHYSEKTMCFVIEDLIEVDEDTSVPVLESLNGFLNKCPAYKILTQVSSKLSTPIDHTTIVKVVLNNYEAPNTLASNRSSGLPNTIRNLIDNSKHKDFGQALQWLVIYRQERLPEEYVVNILNEVVKEGELDAVFVEVYRKICTILQLLEGVRNGKSR